jgi:hypothetical protein
MYLKNKGAACDLTCRAFILFFSIGNLGSCIRAYQREEKKEEKATDEVN